MAIVEVEGSFCSEQPSLYHHMSNLDGLYLKKMVHKKFLNMTFFGLDPLHNMTNCDTLPYYSMRSPQPPSTSPTVSPTSAKPKRTIVGEINPSKPISKRSNICKARRSTYSARHSVRFSESIRKYRYPLCGKKVSRPSS